MNPFSLVLTQELQQQLIQISKTQLPNESCAVLFGNIIVNDEVFYEAIQIVEMENFAHSSVEFKIDELALYSAIKRSEEFGLKLLGIFHSHPDDAYLSNYDRRTIEKISALYPEWIWVVYGNQSRSLRAFFLKKNHQFVELPIRKCI